MQYKVHSALLDDAHEGWIWIKPAKDTKLYSELEARRCIVCIRREKVEKGRRAKAVYCEALLADSFYLTRWGEKDIKFSNDDSAIFISAWYRRLLGMKKVGEVIELDIKPVRTWNLVALLYHYPCNHPQALILTASMMGIIGFGLGVIGIGLGILSIVNWLGFVISGIGLVIAGLGLTGFIRR
jgi:hypothetical protein